MLQFVGYGCTAERQRGIFVVFRLHTPSRSDVDFHLLVIVKLLSGQMILEMQKAVIYFPLSLVLYL